GLNTTENSPDEPVKSRFHSSCPGQEDKAGCRTVSTSGRLLSHCARASAFCSTDLRRTAMVLRPRSARLQSSGEEAQPNTWCVSPKRSYICCADIFALPLLEATCESICSGRTVTEPSSR